MADQTYVLFATVPDYAYLSCDGRERLRSQLESAASKLPGTPVVVVAETGATLTFVPLPGGTAPEVVPADMEADRVG